MEAFTFGKLNGESFEKIVRSLAIEKFGLTGQVYPMGPDAGRDFSYTGSIEGYKNPEWNGYIVLQAKFKKTLRGGSSDVEWLMKQLESELSKYADPDKDYINPEYYIIATNVNLSGADSKVGEKLRKGGMTKISEHLEIWKKKLGLKSFDIWSSEKLETLLALSPNIRTTFAAWVTPGDVLEQLLNNVNAKQKQLSYALKLMLQHSIKKDKNVRLKDAGSVSDDQIRSSQVFVDLPARKQEWGGEEFHFVSESIETAKGIFKPSILSRESAGAGNSVGNVVLLGGPGQGKSTASLFLAQLFRASMLKEDSSQTLEDSVTELVEEFIGRAKEENIPTVLPSRYPFCVSLPQYADKISEAKDKGGNRPSILKHIADEFSDTTDVEVTVSDVREWIGSFPWIVIFDGLDEVPPSGERSAIVSAMQNFLTEVNALDGDVFIIATSRPQGYNSDLNPNLWQHWVLQDLDSNKALAYAKLLTAAYYKDDTDRQRKIINQLESSIKNPTTERLMKSPLQVTILHMIVDTGGGVPTSRWNLFNDYFEILKKREKSKSGQSQKILDKNIHFIGPIHQRAGLLLHVDAEKAGQATSHLDLEKFSALIRNYLESEEFSEKDIKERLIELGELSLNRLVLLSCREEGRISFDVRSLQEFMAASALTASAPEVIEMRLQHLAGKSHWQHVFTIAASRCFSEDNLHYIRSSITGIPRQLDTFDSHRVVGRGALLSLELFMDGIAADQPKHRRQLAIHALELLNHGLDYIGKPLHMLYEPHTQTILFDELRMKYINSSNHEVRAAAWGLILKLASKNYRPAVFFLGEEWPKDLESVFAVVKHGVIPATSNFTLESVRNSILAAGFVAINTEGDTSALEEKYNNLMRINSRESLDYLAELKFLTAYSPKTFTATVLSEHIGVSTVIVAIEGLAHVVRPTLEAKVHPEWSFIFAAADFSRDPSLDTLALCVKSFIDIESDDPKIVAMLRYIPWPVATVLQTELKFLDSVSPKIYSGEYGDVTAWKEAELRLREKGVVSQDFSFTDEFPMNKLIGSVGLVAFKNNSLSGNLGIWKSSGNKKLTPVKLAVFEFVDLISKLKNESALKRMHGLLAIALINVEVPIELSLQESSDLIAVLNDERLSYIYADSLNIFSASCWRSEHLKVLSEICLKARFFKFRTNTRGIRSERFSSALMAAQLILDPCKEGLLNLLCVYKVCYGVDVVVPDELLGELIDSEFPIVSFSAKVLRYIFVESSTDEFLQGLNYALSSPDLRDHCCNVLAELVAGDSMNLARRIELCVKLIPLFEKLGISKFRELKSSLISMLNSDLSGLADKNVWSSLKLPNDAFVA
jgi:hypothetical protein